MPRRRPIGLRKESRDFLAQIRTRRPEYKSAGGALLAEILTGSELSDRTQCAVIYGLEGYRRGLPRLERLIVELRDVVEAGDDPWVGPPERNFLYQILWAVGRMDTLPSHSLLVRLLHGSTSHLVRADALEAMAFEEQNYDLDLVLPFASVDATPPKILSALYALQFKYANKRPEDARMRIAPLLKHDYPLVRELAIQVLVDDETNLDLIRPLENDPVQYVRETVAEAVRRIEGTDER